MIQRVWRGWTTAENADAYERLLLAEILPGIAAKGIDGYRGAVLQRRETADGVEFMTVLRFTTLDAVRALAGEDYETAYVPAAARAVLQRFDERSAHYTLVPLPDGAAPAEESGRTWAGRVRDAVTGSPWHGPSLEASVRGVDAARAAARPIEGAHTIWGLVLHAGAWAEIVTERVQGRNPRVTPEQNFPPVTPTDEAAWAETVADALGAFETLAGVLEEMDEGALLRSVDGRRTAAEQVRWLLAHTAYHAGQIALLRRALGTEPAPS